jgi:hypothetical protein
MTNEEKRAAFQRLSQTPGIRTRQDYADFCIHFSFGGACILYIVIDDENIQSLSDASCYNLGVLGCHAPYGHCAVHSNLHPLESLNQHQQ